MSVVRDNRNSFILSKNGSIHAFKSFKRITELSDVSNVKFFNCFQKCYVLIEQVGADCKLHLYKSFGDEFDASRCEFDLSFPIDAVSAGSSRDSLRVCVEMIEGKLQPDDERFFAELLACDLSGESICDVLLLTSNDRLMWIKYQHGFNDGALDGYSIELITTAKGNIRGLKYGEGFLMMLDDLSTLTVFHLCSPTGLVTKKEIMLDGQVKCFRFHHNTFIYSNLKKIILIDLRNPTEPTMSSINIKGIVCFTVVEELNAIIAICWNRLFYYAPLQVPQQQPEKQQSSLEELPASDIEAIPGVVKFLEQEEKTLLEIEQKVKEAHKLKILLQHALDNKNFTTGAAFITFHRNLPSTIPDGAMLCKVGDQRLGSGFIEIRIEFPKILAAMAFKVQFSRHGPSAVVNRVLKIDSAKEIFHFFMPAEASDKASNKMELQIIFSYDLKGQNHLKTFPIEITKVSSSGGPLVMPRDELDYCIDVIEKLKF